MKLIKILLFATSTAIVITACNTNNSIGGDKKDTVSTNVPQTKPTVNSNKSLEEIPKFSSPEVQKRAEEWLFVYREGMIDAKQKAYLADGDQDKIKEIAAEMGYKFTPWKPRIAELQAMMTDQDKRLFEAYGAKITKELMSKRR